MEEIDPTIDGPTDPQAPAQGSAVEGVTKSSSSTLMTTANMEDESAQTGSRSGSVAEAGLEAGKSTDMMNDDIDPSLRPTTATSTSTSTPSTPFNPIPLHDQDPTQTQDPPPQDPAPQPPSPKSHRIQLDASHLRQSAGASWSARNKLLLENKRLRRDLHGLELDLELDREGVVGLGGAQGVQQEDLLEDGDEDGERSLMEIMQESLRVEIEELKGRLGEPGSSSGSSDIVTTAVPNSTMDFSEPALDPESTSTPALTSTSTSTSTSTLYTLIAHLTSSLRTQTAHLSTLQTELKGLVWEDTLAHRASGSGSRTGTQAGGDRGRLWRTGPGPGASTSTSTSVGLKARGAQRDSRRPSGVGDDMDTAEDEEQLDLDLELEKEEKEMLNGPEQTELEKALLDLRGYAEVAAHLWDEENRLPDASNYLNPVYPVFALPYVPKRIYGPRRGRVPVNVGKKEIPTELRRLIARRAKGKNVDHSLVADTGEGSSVGEASGSRSGNREGEERGGFGASMEDYGPDTYLDDYLKGRKRLAIDPTPLDSRIPKKRGRPTLLDMRRKGLEPTIFETLALNSESASRGTNVNGLGSGMASGLFSDEFIYPDPPPGTPAWDPSNLQFHTQVPYQIQMARQEYASRLARSFVASVPGVAEEMGDYLPEITNEQPRSSSSVPREDGVPDFSLEDLQRNGIFDNEFPSTQSRSQGSRVQADEDAENAAAFNKMQNLSVREVTCENCGRTGTSVWRKLSVGRYDAKRTYRVCNPCGLHYTKNLVMRPKDNWGDVNKAPRKRRPAKPKIAAVSPATVQQDEQSLQEQIEGQQLGLGPEGTLQIVNIDMADRIM